MTSAAAIRASVERGDPLAVRADRNLRAMRSDSEHPWPEALLDDLGDYRTLTAYRSGVVPLTDRELDCLRCVSHGMDYAHAADALGISPNTVHTHLSMAQAKLRAKNTQHSVAIAIRNGLIA